jgi:hypothetical protein
VRVERSARNLTWLEMASSEGEGKERGCMEWGFEIPAKPISGTCAIFTCIITK